MDTVPLVMRNVVAELRAQRPRGLSVPQFRVLAYLRHHPGSNLSDLAQHFGLTAPTMSRMVDGLVRRGFVVRAASAQDRRRVTLKLSRAGLGAFNTARSRVESRMAARVSNLSHPAKRRISEAMKLMQTLFDMNRTEA